MENVIEVLRYDRRVLPDGRVMHLLPGIVSIDDERLRKELLADDTLARIPDPAAAPEPKDPPVEMEILSEHTEQLPDRRSIRFLPGTQMVPAGLVERLIQLGVAHKPAKRRKAAKKSTGRQKAAKSE